MEKVLAMHQSGFGASASPNRGGAIYSGAHYDIFFVQEPPWNFIRYAPSAVSLEGDKVVGAPIHPDWTQVVRVPKDSEDIP